jgi:hypothetical protein
VGAIFTPIYPDELQISVARIQILINSYRERKRTGIIRLGYPSKKYLQLLFKRGELLNSYFTSAEVRESLAPGQWTQYVESAGDAYTKIIPLSPFGLFVAKLLITSDGIATNDFSQSNQLSEYIASLGKSPDVSVVQLNWDRAMGGILFSGLQNDPHALFLSQVTILDETGTNKISSLLNEPRCTVTTIVPDLSIGAWQEFYLRQSFADICGRMLGRFEAMTGRALVDSLVRLIAVSASRNDLEINISSRKLVDNEIFSSPQDAAQSYRQLLKEMFSHFSAVIGPRLLSFTIQEIVAGFPEHEREVIRAFDLFPEGYFYESKNA